MPVTILVPGVLRGECDDQPRLTLDASGTLEDVLTSLAATWPRLARRIRDEQGEIRKFINVYVDGEDARRLADRDTPVRDNAEIQLIPSVAGG